MAVDPVPADSSEARELYNLSQLCLDNAWFRAIVANPDAQYATVKAWVEANGDDVTIGRDEAAAKIGWLVVDEQLHPEDESSEPPRIIIDHELDDQSAERNGGDDWTQRCNLVVEFELWIPECYQKSASRRDASLYALNIVGGFRDGLRTTGGLSGRLSADRIGWVPLGYADPTKVEGDWLFGARFLVQAQGI